MFIYNATVLKVIDGDTIDCLIDLGFDISHKIRFRLDGIDTPEKTSKVTEEKKLAFSAQEFVKTKVEGKKVILHSFKPDKYGRYLCKLFLGEECINESLVTSGLAKAYHGESKDGLWSTPK